MKKILKNLEIYLGVLCQGIMIIILFIQVIFRYVFNYSFAWVEEIALILFVFSVYFGATAAIKRRQHLRLEIVLTKLSEKSRLVLEIVNNAFFALFNFIILTGIIPIILKLKKNNTITAVTSIPKWLIYSVLPILFILMIYRLFEDSKNTYKKIKSL